MKVTITKLKDLSNITTVIYFLSKENSKDLGNLEHGTFLKKIAKQNKDLCNIKNIVTGFTETKESLIKIIVCGIGAEKDFTSNILRKAAGEAARYIDEKNDNKVLVVAPIVTDSATLAAMVEGLVLGAYKFTSFKSEKKKKNILEYMLAVEVVKGKQVLEDALLLANNICWVRDLVNGPGNIVTPRKIAQEALNMAKDLQLSCEILGKKEMLKKGMGAILAVGQGSAQEAKLITLKYEGAGKKSPYLAYVGKGVTFDSGGISLKPAAGMEEMKDDMTGAAVVLGAIKTIAELKLPINIMAIAACAENMPSGTAIKPGDVIKSASGKTIEIINTDAEGRMVLADAVWYACEQGAVKVLDIATLTGACITALGNVTAGIITNNQEFCENIIAAGKLVGESYWQLPSLPELKEKLKGDVGDLLNSAGSPGGAITGGLFVGEFVQENIPWAHVDIGGTATVQKNDGFWTKGATGMGVATLVALAKETK